MQLINCQNEKKMNILQHNITKILLINLTVSTLSCAAQKTIAETPKGILEYDLEIAKGFNSVKLYQNESIVIEKLGTPTSSMEYDYEMRNTIGNLLNYGSNEIYIMHDRLDAFTLNDDYFKVGIHGNYISVGDDISKVYTMYSLAGDFKNHYYFRIQLTLGDRENEGAFLIIEFNSSTNKVTKIWKYES